MSATKIFIIALVALGCHCDAKKETKESTVLKKSRQFPLGLGPAGPGLGLGGPLGPPGLGLGGPFPPPGLGGPGYYPAPYVEPYYPPPRYNFDYGIDDDYSNNHYGHSEIRDGNVVQGKYYVHLPDGRMQTVTYTADEYGFHPVVSYEGYGQHPTDYGGPVGPYGPGPVGPIGPYGGGPVGPVGPLAGPLGPGIGPVPVGGPLGGLGGPLGGPGPLGLGPFGGGPFGGPLGSPFGVRVGPRVPIGPVPIPGPVPFARKRGIRSEEQILADLSDPLFRW